MMIGVYMDLMDSLHQSAHFTPLLKSPEMMHYIDQDDDMSQAFRRGVPLPSYYKKKDSGSSSSSIGGGSGGSRRKKRREAKRGEEA